MLSDLLADRLNRPIQWVHSTCVAGAGAGDRSGYQMIADEGSCEGLVTRRKESGAWAAMVNYGLRRSGHLLARELR